MVSLMQRSAYQPTRQQVKRALARAGISMRRAALDTSQSAALISMVLAGKVTSRPCLDRLTALLIRKQA